MVELLQYLQPKHLMNVGKADKKKKKKYPNLGAKPGGSDFLRKRLQKGPKMDSSGVHKHQNPSCAVPTFAL
uniref:Uncharacterized protein n=1 Tax=Gouania willdenowi TaxID=441366 RepID=A0A8C5ECP3_GOUWI